MAERRQAQRREPITVEVREREVEAHPLPWFKRNDLGNAIMKQYSDILNIALKTYQAPPTAEGEITAPELSIHLNDKISDPEAVVAIGYPEAYEEDKDFFHGLDYPELLELIYASLEVNELSSLKELVDPNSLAPTTSGGNDSSGTTPAELGDTPNLQSTPDSSSEDSVGQPSSI